MEYVETLIMRTLLLRLLHKEILHCKAYKIILTTVTKQSFITFIQKISPYRRHSINLPLRTSKFPPPYCNKSI